MCRAHWSMVDPAVQREVWRTYRPGQTALTASAEWRRAAGDAIRDVAAKEGRELPRVWREFGLEVDREP